MEDKTFELLTVMYSEMQGMKGEMQGMKGEMQGIRGEMQGMKDDIKEIKITMATKQDLVRMENKMDDQIRALYEGYQQCSEDVTEMKMSNKVLKSRVDNLEMRLEILE